MRVAREGVGAAVSTPDYLIEYEEENPTDSRLTPYSMSVEVEPAHDVIVLDADINYGYLHVQIPLVEFFMALGLNPATLTRLAAQMVSIERERAMLGAPQEE